MNNVTNIIQAVQLYLTSIPPSSWYALAVFVGSTGFTMGIVQAIKKRYNLTHEEELAKHWIAIILGGIPLVLTSLQGFIMYGTTNPKLLGERTLEIVGVANLAFLTLSSIRRSKLVQNVQTWANNGRTAYTTIEAQKSNPTPAAAATDLIDSPLS